MVMAGPFCTKGGLRGWSSSVGCTMYISLGGHCLFSVLPLSAPTDLMDATGPPGVGC